MYGRGVHTVDCGVTKENNNLEIKTERGDVLMFAEINLFGKIKIIKIPHIFTRITNFFYVSSLRFADLSEILAPFSRTS